jgi:hypothetical protein
MATNSPNRLVYVFPAVALAAAALYYGYGAMDRLGLEIRETEARVTAKQVTPGSTTYYTRIVGGRAWSQAAENPGLRVVVLAINGEETGAAVERSTFDSLEEGDRVRVRYQRTRLTNQVLVTDVRQ